ncbi:MAG TPA: dihydrolipoyllysine-residue acetyltransferase [Candidatus Baltobacteraceae bacterium]|jgi:pyruvate dehydrogenase E2 component (dihydrolipoamide acetyltransferase)|nr:dihydrolipoyllysine-residue acetyltransferase [Candidatus Baltobacteraceae bacterium]
MSQTIEVHVPNIGDFKDIAVIDVLVKPGDVVKIDDPLVTLESEKATMEVPASHAGVVADLKIRVGDKVSEGSTILTLQSDAPAADGAAPAAPSSAPAAASTSSLAAPTTAPRAASQEQGERLVELRVPDIGDFKDISVIDVLVKPGDRIERDASLITLESEKATMDVPASSAGVIRSLAVKLGDKVSQGSLVGVLTVTDAAAIPTGPAQQATAPAPQAASSERPAPAQTSLVSAEPSSASSNGIVHASPAIRRFARELGVGLQIVSGTGPNGRVTREDVQGYVKRALSASSASPALSGGGTFPGLPAWPKVDFAQYGPIELKPLSRIKKISGPILHRNWVMIPHVTNNEEADITELEAFRQRLNTEQGAGGAKVTILAFLMKALVASLVKFPEFNASLDGDALVLKRYYSIGFAADTPNGLVVPVIRDVDKKGVVALANETKDLAAKARDGKLTPAEMSGGTFTISSLGGIGGTTFTPIINAPEVAILGVCRSTMRPVWDGKTFVPRLMLPLSLSYDHRVIDGAAAARFNVYLAELLADMRRVML